MASHFLQVESTAIDRLFCSPTNPRRNEAAVPHVEASIRRFGFQQPVVAKRSGEVIAGNTRLKAAQRLKLAEVPVVWFEGSDLEATAYQIADNRTHEFAEWDEPALAKLLQQLRAEDAAQDIGFSVAEIDVLLSQFAAEPGATEDPGPEAPPAKPVSRKGDLWLLGAHRLLCGDSTAEADVLKVMGGETAALVATDPPYLVDYTGERPNDSGKDWTDSYREIDIKDAPSFFRGLFQNVLRVLAPNGAIYTWHAHKRQATIARIWEELGILDHQQIIWVKPTPVFGRVYWHFRHEPCLFGWRQGSKPEHDGQHEHDSVWEIDWEGKQRIVGNEHPCLHPDALVLTDRGFRPISVVLVGDRMMAADGAFHRVSVVSSHRYTSPELFRISAGQEMPVLASDNHPFLVWRGGEAGWVRADELRVGDCTMTPLPAERFMQGPGISGVGFAGCTHTLRPITRIDRVPYSGDVWNLSVDGCPSFHTSVGMTHNTQKPVEIFARPMRKHTKPGDVVFEPFSGSGSQLIAAEQLGRKCRAIEISPAFVDVGLRRWERATNKQALLSGTGQTFAQVEAERGSA